MKSFMYFEIGEVFLDIIETIKNSLMHIESNTCFKSEKEIKKYKSNL